MRHEWSFAPAPAKVVNVADIAQLPDLSNNCLMFGITIRTSGAARSFWQLVDHASAFEHEPSIRSLNYAPHMTLARYEDIDRALLIAGLKVFQDIPPITLVFDRIDVFDTEPLALWLNPHANSELSISRPDCMRSSANSIAIHTIVPNSGVRTAPLPHRFC
jgi:hypothetical protein